MRIFLTGIDGFAGRHLAARLAGDGHDVVGSSLEPGDILDGVEVWSCDVRDPDRVESVIAEAGPARSSISPARPASRRHSGDRERRSRSMRSALHVLEACRQAGVEASPGRDLERDLRATIGRGGTGPGERAAGSRDPVRGEQGRAGPDRGPVLARLRSAGDPRPGVPAYTGPGQDPRCVPLGRPPDREGGGRSRPTVLEIGNLDPTRDVSHVRDVVEAYAGLLRQGTAGEAYNVCSGVGRTIGEALEALASLSNVEIGFEVDPRRLRPAEVPWMVGDPARAREDRLDCYSSMGGDGATCSSTGASG